MEKLLALILDSRPKLLVIQYFPFAFTLHYNPGAQAALLALSFASVTHAKFQAGLSFRQLQRPLEPRGYPLNER